MRLAMASDCAECDAGVGKQHRLDPFRTDVPAKGGNEEIVLASVNRQEPVAVDLAEIAGPPWPLRRPLVRVAIGDRRAVDDDLACVDRNAEPIQRPADGAGRRSPGAVDAHDGAAFGKAVAFVRGNPERPGGFRDLRWEQGRRPPQQIAATRERACRPP